MPPLRQPVPDRRVPSDPSQAEPEDYSDEVSEADLQALRERVAEDPDAEDWEIVDGPAW